MISIGWLGVGNVHQCIVLVGLSFLCCSRKIRGETEGFPPTIAGKFYDVGDGKKVDIMMGV